MRLSNFSMIDFLVSPQRAPAAMPAGEGIRRLINLMSPVVTEHRKLALETYEPTNLPWATNNYDQNAISPPVLIELGRNVSTVAQAASMGKVFRDMAAIASHRGAQNHINIRPHLSP